jgi:FkbM family methyltransferase
MDLKLVKSLIGEDNQAIVEVGGHYGEDTVILSKEFPYGHVHCFEPDPRNLKILDRLSDIENVTIYDLAVSDIDDDKVAFYPSYKSDVPERMFKKYNWIYKDEYLDLKINGSGASSLKKGYKYAQEPIYVKTIRLDTWMSKRNIDVVDFLWVDVQGAEKNVIDGLGKKIQNVKCIWIEYGETFYEGGLTRKQTIDLITSTGHFKVVSSVSDSCPKGNLLFAQTELS